MNKETFFKILNNHFQQDETNNFHGIFIKPQFKGEYITFDFENPNNISFNKVDKRSGKSTFSCL